jgi:hypothetical protein
VKLRISYDGVTVRDIYLCILFSEWTEIVTLVYVTRGSLSGKATQCFINQYVTFHFLFDLNSSTNYFVEERLFYKS